MSCCRTLPGTIFKINIPAGAVINFFNLIEIASPSGICIVVRIPILGGTLGTGWEPLFDAIRRAGGTVTPA